MEKAIKNITAERIVVGILLNHPEWSVELSGQLKAEYFFLKSHKTLFYIIAALLREGDASIDSMSILARAEKIAKASDVLNENGGIEYIEEIKYLAEDYKVDDLKKYADDIASSSFKRDLILLNVRTGEVLYENPDMTFAEVEIWYQEQFQELVNSYSSKKRIAFIGEVFDEVWARIESNRSINGIVGLPSKFPMVNKYFTYMKSELVVIGARAKYGKSNYAINETHNLAVLNGIPVAIFDTEMKTETFLIRIIALDSGVPIEVVKNGTYKHDEDMLRRVEMSKERVKNAPILHEYDAYWDKAKVAHKAKLLKLRHNLGLLIYDYIKVKDVGSNVKEHSELGNWTIFLKDLAGDLDIPILTFAQLSPGDKRLADSDKINRYASTVAYLLPKSNKQIAEHFGADSGGTDYMFVEYNRNGAFMSDPNKETGINFIYKRYLASFEQAPYQVLEDEYM